MTSSQTAPLRSPHTAAGRRTEPSRHTGLDLVRGAAVIGTLGTNIWLFTHPAGLLGSLIDPTAGLAGADALLYRILTTLTNGKFLALLMMVFGMGLALQLASWQRQQPSARGWIRSYLPRAFILFVDGFVNFLLIAEFDVLMGYALTGVVVASIICGSDRAQRAWAIAAGALHTAGLLVLAAALTALPADAMGTSPDSPAEWRLYGGANPYREGGFGDLVLLRIDNALLFRAEPILTLALGVCLFIVGSRLLSAGVFSPGGAGLRRRLLLIVVPAAALDIACGLIGSPALVLVQRYLTAPLAALGILAVLAAAALRAQRRLASAGRRPGLLRRALEACGRMSLTIYVGQNLLAGALLYGWGLDLAGRFADHRLALTVCAFAVVAASMIGFALAWQRWAPASAGRGPLEWLSARSLAVLRAAGRSGR